MKKRILSAVLALALVISACFCVSADSAKSPLRFDENGEFKIMHLCDCQDGYPASEKMLKFIDAALKEYQPDIVVLGGDNVVSDFEDKDEAIKELVDVFVANETYFTLVFGNHDCEQGMTNDELMVLYQKYGGEYCLASDPEPELHGCGTQMLPVLSTMGDSTEFALYMFDSGSHAYDENGNDVGYDCVHEDQIEWYKDTSKNLEAQEGKKIPGLAFQHIVVGEAYDALFYETSNDVDLGVLTPKYNGKTYTFFPRTNNFTGFLLEFPCPGYYNYGQFDAMVERGDILGIFSGHDHINNYETELDGIKIINTAGATFNSYGKEMTRGMRMITVRDSNTWEFETESVTINGFALGNDDFASDAGIISIFAMITEGLAKVMLALGEFSGLFAGVIDLIK